MRRLLSINVILTGLTFLIAADASAAQTEVIDRLKSGGHILMIRHALAPGSGDPPNLKISECLRHRSHAGSGIGVGDKLSDFEDYRC